MFEHLRLAECVEEAGFAEKFCMDGGISALATVCLVGFVLGTIGILVSLKLRRNELILLHRVVDSTTDFYVANQRNDGSDDGVDWQPEHAYRRLAKLNAQRSGKTATLVSLLCEDALMFVVNGAFALSPAAPINRISRAQAHMTPPAKRPPRSPHTPHTFSSLRRHTHQPCAHRPRTAVART